MGGDHHYVKPKTDGTFGLRTDWRLLSKQAVAAERSTVKLPSIQPLTEQELQTKTLRELWYWRGWRSSSPFAQYRPSYLWKVYQLKYLQSSKFPSGQVIKHFLVGMTLVGLVGNYSNVRSHAYAVHH